MFDHVYQAIAWLKGYPDAYSAGMGAALLIFAALSTFLLKVIFINGIYRLFSQSPLVQTFQQLPTKVISRILHVVPALSIMYGVPYIPEISKTISTIIANLCSAFIVLTLAMALCSVLDMINTAYQSRTRATQRTIKSYIQICKIVVYCVTTILCIAALVDKSPLIMFSGLGALAAVAVLVFQSTLHSLVASIQISSSEIVRLGDWIEVPQFNANGDVIDIALHQILVRNHDFTLTTIPTRAIVEGSFKNWRGMRECGGRRIMRSLFIDQNTVGFLTPEEKTDLSRFSLLRDYLIEKDREINAWNEKLPEAGKDEVNQRRLTNLGTFRAYLEQYLRNHPGVHQGMTLMVRLLDPTPTGLPVEIYVFANTTAWVDYERIQGDIFDHVISILPEFGLSVHQSPSGVDLRALRPDYDPLRA